MVSLPLDLSDDEDIIVKRKSGGRKFVGSDDEEAQEQSGNIHKKRFNLVDSSDEESMTNNDAESQFVSTKHSELPDSSKLHNKKKRISLVDSSDEESETNNGAESEFILTKHNDSKSSKPKRNKKRFSLVDSSDEDSTTKDSSKLRLTKDNDLYDSERSDDESSAQRDKSRVTSTQDSGDEVPTCELSSFSFAKNNDLYDAEGSDDEVPKPDKKSRFALQTDDLYDAEDDESYQGATPEVPKKGKRPTSERQSKTNAVQQIHSETQRLVRESRVSLPYHRPRQRSLMEFLQRRHTPAAVISDRSRVREQLEQQEKEAQEFYKSDSDDADDNDSQSSAAPSQNISIDVQSSVVKDTSTSTEQEPGPTLPGSVEGQCPSEDSGSNNKQSPLDEVIKFPSSDDRTEPSVELPSSDQNITTKVFTFPSKSLPDDRTEPSVEMPSSGQDITTKVFTFPSSEGESPDDGSGRVFTFPAVTENSNEAPDDAVFAVPTSKTVPENLPEDSCDFHLHYSESQSMDTEGASAVTSSALYDDESNAMDVQLTSDTKNVKEDLLLHYSETQDSAPETVVPSTGADSKQEEGPRTETVVPPTDKNSADYGNTEDLVLHYSETQNAAPTKWFENMRPLSPDSDSRDATALTDIKTEGKVEDEKTDEKKEILQRLARRSLPGVGDITKMKPRLSGAPDEVIELEDEEETGPRGVVKLVQRFIKHSTAKPVPEEKHAVNIGVVSAEDGQVQKDVVTVVLGGEGSQEDPLMNRPGAQLQRLKTELQQQMAQRRAEEWGRRVQEMKLDNEEDLDEELSDCGGILDEADEMEAEMTDTETESEEEEDDVPIVEKKRVRSAFVDDEADVTEDEGSGDDDGAGKEGIEDLYGGKDEDDDNTMSRKLETEEVDSDDQDSENEEKAGDEGNKKDKKIDIDNQDSENEEKAGDEGNKKDKTIVNDNEDSEEDEDDEENKKDDITATAGNTENEDTNKETWDASSTVDNTTHAGSEISQVTTKLERAKTFDLFASQEDGGDSDFDGYPPYQLPGLLRKQTTPSVDAEDDRRRRILDLVSPVSIALSTRGTPSTQAESPLTSRTLPPSMPKKLFSEAEPLNTQDNMDELLGLCSGKFTGAVGGLVDPTMDDISTTELLGLCSGKFPSQPVDVPSQEQTQSKRFRVLLPSSDAEEEVEEDVLKSKPRGSQKKLDFSDESDAESDDTAEVPNDDQPKLVDYDSEENEVVREPTGRRAAEFFEDEAELSESEWDSADEDEQGLDALEWEDGDADTLDQGKVKEQLDKIHMRRLLDEDRREVRLLQEILLEDGELHSEGSGRERKFRWKNINNADDADLPQADSDNEVADDVEHEDEERWRRMRHEREMFLEQQKMKAGPEIEDLSTDSQLLKLGHAALRRLNSQEQTPSVKRTMSDPLLSPDPKHPFKLLTKRGSFLARGDSALAKIAELTRGAASGPVKGGPNNSRNFVFATLSPEKAESKAEVKAVEVKKRKSLPGTTPPVLKRLRMSDQHSRGSKLLDLLS